MRLVLDTNVIISAFINPNGIPSGILKLILQHEAEICFNTVILSEYESVALRRKFSSKIEPGIISRFINLIRNIGYSFDPVPGKIKMPDISDRIFYDTAKGSGSVLITGNIKHYPKESFIMLPVDFIKKLNFKK